MLSLALSLPLSLALGELGGCHQTFTAPDQPDLYKVPLQFGDLGLDFSVEMEPHDLAVPVDKDLAVPKPDMTQNADLNQ